jgi:hypothetical protein
MAAMSTGYIGQYAPVAREGEDRVLLEAAESSTTVGWRRSARLARRNGR